MAVWSRYIARRVLVGSSDNIVSVISLSIAMMQDYLPIFTTIPDPLLSVCVYIMLYPEKEYEGGSLKKTTLVGCRRNDITRVCQFTVVQLDDIVSICAAWSIGGLAILDLDFYSGDLHLLL